MEKYILQGKDAWPLYEITQENNHTVRVVRFFSVGPRTVYEKDDSSDNIRVFTVDYRLQPASSGAKLVSDEEYLKMMMERGNEKLAGEKIISGQRTMERLHLDDSISRDVFDANLNLEQLLHLHGLKVVEPIRGCQGYTWW